MSFGDGIDQLRASYRRGLLVPFIGSGLSAPKMRTWSSLVRTLADIAGIEDLHLPKRPTDQQLILASERVVWQLRARGHSLGTKMDDALPDPVNSGMDVPAATQALASVWWPLVLTTNYDDLFLKFFNKRHQLAKRHDADAMAVLGRGAADCHTVLNSLNQPYRPLLWALQGFLGPSLHGADLRPEIVLGYEQYRRVTFENAAFRSAFTELFRNRSFLFAGSGLSEDYFRGLFGESIVRLGAHQHAHCALINEKDVDQDTPWFLHTRLNIVVMTYADPVDGPKYSGFAPCLEEIAEALNEPPRGGRRFWVRNILPASVCIDIEPTSLPPREGDTHWIVGSAGRGSSDKTLISSDVPKTLRGTEVEVPGHDDLLRIEGRNVLLAIARKSKENGGAARDLRRVADVTSHALSVAVDQGATTVSLMLLSASPHARRWPRVFSLVEMLRGIRHYAYNRSRGRHAPLRVILHDTAAARPADRAPSCAVWYAIESGRFDPAEVLDCNALRLFVEIHLEGEIIRMPMYVFDNKTIGQVASYLGLAEGWKVLLDPDPTPKPHAQPIDPTQSLLDAGVVPGSTLQFHPVTQPKFDQDFWEQLWSKTLREDADKVAHRLPNAQLMAEVANLPPGRALDAGCGHGADTLWLAAHGWQVTAVDFSAAALAHGRAMAEAAGADVAKRIDWIESDLATWTVEPGYYDLVVSLYVHVAGSVKDMVGRMANGVAPGGTLFLVGHRPIDPSTGVATAAASQVQVSVEDAVAALDSNVWELVVAEERPRAVAGTGVDAVIRARRRT